MSGRYGGNSVVGRIMDADDLEEVSKSKKDMKALRGRLIEQGWRVHPTKGGHVAHIPPDPSKQIVHGPSSPSDWRSYKNLVADLKRQGYVGKADEYGYEQPRRSFAPWVTGGGLGMAAIGGTALANSHTLDHDMGQAASEQKVRTKASKQRLRDAKAEYKLRSDAMNKPTPRSVVNPARYVRGPMKQAPMKGGVTWQYRDSRRKEAERRLNSVREEHLREKTALRNINSLRKNPVAMEYKRATMARGGTGALAAGLTIAATPWVSRRVNGGQ